MSVSGRIDKSFVVFESIENGAHDRCVDFFRRPDGSFGFEEFRRDVEDQGRWTPVQFYSGASYPAEDEVRRKALATVRWLSERDEGSGTLYLY